MDALCFVDVSYLELHGMPTPTVAEVWSEMGRLGVLSGVVIDPSRRTLEYLVVASDQQLHAVPAAGSHMDASGLAIVVDMEKNLLSCCPTLDDVLEAGRPHDRTVVRCSRN